jgi:hypothetical protein
MKDGTIIQCVTDVDNVGHITIQEGIVRDKYVFLEDKTITTLKDIRNFFKRENLIEWCQYNKKLREWNKIGNIKVLKEEK